MQCGLHWGLQQDWSGGGLLGVCAVLLNAGVFQCGGGAAWQSQRTEPCQCISGQPWACYGLLQAQMQPLQRAVGVVEPALGAAAGLGSWRLLRQGCGFAECWSF